LPPKRYIGWVGFILAAAVAFAAISGRSDFGISTPVDALMGAIGRRSTKPDSNAFVVGINVGTINNWDGSRPFMNLIYGSSWQMQNTAPWGGYEDVPTDSLDANGWVKSVPKGYQVVRGLSVPLTGGEFVCRFQGAGVLRIEGPAVRDLRTKTGATQFVIAATYPEPKGVVLSFSLDSADYIRNINCREVTAAQDQTFAPEFTEALAGFKVIRFMKWQTATEGNWPVTWARRNKPDDGDYLKNDGVPVETLIDLANQADADPWVTMPWNADDDYIARFATYVRDHLSREHRVYVEVSNEVWNAGYPASRQAASEAQAEQLPSASGSAAGAALERYAEKTRSVMKIWSDIFQGQSQRLVRVASFQHVSPPTSDRLLNYKSLARSIDAMATAPYFGYEISDALTADQIWASLPAQMNESVSLGIKQKQVAKKYGLRYITYEAGQAIVLRDNLALEQQVQRDPRMDGLYGQFLQSWRTQVGDNLNLFALNGPIGQYGAWGLSEYVGQPLSDAPKMRGVKSFLRPKHAATTGLVVPPSDAKMTTS
jgi:hypothetical protein